MTRNFNLKILSLTAAIIASLYVNSDANITVRTVRVPVDYPNIGADKVIVSEINKEVNVTVRGPSFMVSRFENSTPIFKAQIPTSVGNRYTVKLNKDSLDILPPLEVIEIEPDEFDVRFDNKSSKEVDIEIPTVGQLKNKLKISKIEIRPPRISVVGAESVVKRTRAIFTEQLDLETLEISNAGESDTIALKLTSPGLGATLEPTSQVDVTVFSSLPPIRKAMKGLKIEYRGKDSASISPTSASIEVSGSPTIIKELKSDSIKLFVKDSKNGGSSSDISWEAPEGVEVISISPSQVSLKNSKR